MKQGAVISPILCCIHKDDSLNRLKLHGIGCYIGLNFTGALAYADDLVLLSPTPSAMRKMLAICDVFAAEYDILFNAGKSKFLVIATRKR
jgi:Reverse transcriptase (RNA-dependent DNA polymerase)